MVEVCVLGEQLGRHVAPVPFFGTNLAQHVLRVAAADADLPAGTREAAARWTSDLATGGSVGCVAWSPAGEELSGSTEGTGSTGSTEGTGSPDGTGSTDGTGLLTARPEPTLFASMADVAVVVAADAVYAVGLDPGERPPPEPAMDRTRSLSWLRLDAAPVLRLGVRRQLAASVLDRAAAATSAEMLGSSSRVLEMSVAYAKDRHQFGKPIGSFQAVKHRLADALVDVEAMRSSVYFAAWSLGAGEVTASLAASAAKAWCSDASRPGDGVGAAGPRRHRVHLGARPPPVRQAIAARPVELGGCRVPSRADRLDAVGVEGVGPEPF